MINPNLEVVLIEGDIIFINNLNPVSREVARVCQTWATHIGIIFFEEDVWQVAESTFPFSRKITLQKFIDNSHGGQLEIYRVENLSYNDILELKKASNSYMRIPYDLCFNYDSKWLYCSKFVYLTYLNALKIKIGKVETFRDMIESNPNFNLAFWRLWYLGRIPWDKKCISISSIISNRILTKVYPFSSTQL